MRYCYLFDKDKVFPEDRLVQKMSLEKAKVHFSEGKHIWAVSDDHSFSIQAYNGEAVIGIGQKPQFSTRILEFYDEGLNTIAEIEYTNINRHIDQNPDRFFLTSINLREWDDEHLLHGHVTNFWFAKYSQIFFDNPNDGIKDHLWEIKNDISLIKSDFCHSEMLEEHPKKELSFPKELNSDSLWINLHFGEWDELITHAKNTWKHFKKIAEDQE